MVADAKNEIEQLLKRGPKSEEALRRAYLGSPPQKPEQENLTELKTYEERRKAYDTKYQRFRRALEAMEEVLCCMTGS